MILALIQFILYNNFESGDNSLMYSMFGLQEGQNAFHFGFNQVALLFGVGLIVFIAYKFFKE